MKNIEKNGSREWIRTTDPHHVKVVLLQPQPIDFYKEISNCLLLKNTVSTPYISMTYGKYHKKFGRILRLPAALCKRGAIYIAFSLLAFSGTTYADGFFIGGGVGAAGHSSDHSSRAAWEVGYQSDEFIINYRATGYTDGDYQTVSMVGNVWKNLYLGVGGLRSGHEDFDEKENSFGLVAELPFQLTKRLSIAFNAGIYDTERKDPYGVTSSNTVTETTHTHQIDHVGNDHTHTIVDTETETTNVTASEEERNDYTATAGLTARWTF